MENGIPTFAELFSDLSVIERLFLPGPDAPVTVPWYRLTKDGYADSYVTAREIFQRLHDRFEDEFPFMSWTPPAVGQSQEQDRARTFGGLYCYNGKDRKFEEGSELEPPVWFGENVVLRNSALSVGPSVYGNHVHLGGSTKVRYSFLRDKVCLKGKCDIAGAVIGRDVYIDVGCNILPERRPEHNKLFTIRDMRKPGLPAIQTGRSVMGAVIADGCTLGAGVTLSPFVILAEPGMRVPDGTILRSGIYNQEAIDRLP